MSLPTFANIAIGLIFIYLILSLLASEVQEIISSLLELRAKGLKQGIKTILGESHLGKDSKITNLLYEHSLISALNQKSFFGRQLNRKSIGPAYIPAEIFSATLFSILNKESAKSQSRDEGKSLDLNNMEGMNIPQIINEIDALNLPPELRDNLVALVLRAERNTTHFREEVERWFDRSMERAGGSYKRDAKVWAIFIGFLIALSSNADTLNIFSKLSKDGAISESIASYVKKEQEKCSKQEEVKRLDCLSQAINNDDLTKLALPIGWESSDLNLKSSSNIGANLKNGFLKIIGWLLTGIAISMGSSFWFDLLNKVINVRYTGSNPAEANAKKAK
jgi:hypothetical protein